MRRLACFLLASAVVPVLACSATITMPPPSPAPSAQPTERVPTPPPPLASGQYTEPAGHWSVAFRKDKWQTHPEDDSTLHHASLDCGLVLAGWPMGMEGPEAELFEMREQQTPVELGDRTFLRSILLATSDQAGYTGEIAYYLSEGEVFAHIVLLLGKELYGNPEVVARCQEDAEAVVSTLRVE
jgi:hypothetical protein